LIITIRLFLHLEYNFSISIGQANYLPSNGHYYQFIPSIGITWTAAKYLPKTLFITDYKDLATITSADEAKISGEQAGAGWIGGSDAATEGVRKWVTGPEGLADGGTGTTFWNGLANGSTTPPYNFCLMEYRRAKSIQWSQSALTLRRTWCWYYRVLE
jgi:hypothetical protein